VESETLPSAASPAEPSELAEWLAQGQDLLEDVRLSLNTRYPVESEAEEDEDLELDTPPLRGIQIALATFVPTFLVVFLGLPYLLPEAPPSITPETFSADSPRLLSPSAAVSLDRWTAASPELLETWLVNGAWANDAPALAPRRDGFEPKPVKSVSGDTASWARAAAFADERAAARLAASMRSQGYRVDVRQEDSATLPWVVWISKSSSPSRK
jgi:hypothetical protein